MIQFYAPLDVVSEKFYQAWAKWHLNGLDETIPIEWHIDAGDLATAELAFKHLGLPDSACTWRKS
jgi:hypothetical protein